MTDRTIHNDPTLRAGLEARREAIVNPPESPDGSVPPWHTLWEREPGLRPMKAGGASLHCTMSAFAWVYHDPRACEGDELPCRGCDNEDARVHCEHAAIVFAVSLEDIELRCDPDAETGPQVGMSIGGKWEWHKGPTFGWSLFAACTRLLDERDAKR